MSDPNPYQPPQTPEPLKPTQLAKRGFGVAAILLLTPVAMFSPSSSIALRQHRQLTPEGW
jgi:hypothetical protein